MKMVFNSKTIISIVLITLLLSVVPVSAVVYNVGVKAGDWARYDVSVIWESTDPNIPTPSFLQELEEQDWFSITVQSVSGKMITAQQLIHLNNGTDLPPETIQGDISTGSGGVTAFFSPKDLSEGNMIPGLWAINETISRNYAGLTRDVNHLSKHLTESDEPLRIDSYDFGISDITWDWDYYFDRATGIICEVSYIFFADNGTHTMNLSIKYTMIETNLWSLPQPFWTQWWLWAIIVGTVIIIASAVIILKRRKKPKPIIIAPPETKPV